MRKLTGLPCNLDEPILGRIVKDLDEKRYKFKSILVTNSPGKNINKHLAVVSDLKTVGICKTPALLGVARTDELNTGDVVRLNLDGTLDVLYERQSPHNILFVTEQCNCSCLICPQPTVKTKSDLTDSVLELVRLIDPDTKTLCITGGEPTLLGDNFFKIIQCCKECLPHTALQVLSNGIRFCEFDFTKSFVRIGHPNIQVGIPLYADTDTEHNYMVQVTGFQNTIKGMQNLALFRQKIEIRTVVNALNYRRLPSIAEFIYRNFPFVVHVAFMGMETRELARKNVEQVWIDPYEYGSLLGEAVEILNLRRIPVSVYNHQLCTIPEAIWPFACKSISLWKNIYLDECKKCDLRNICGGFFESCSEIHSKHIKAIKRTKQSNQGSTDL